MTVLSSIVQYCFHSASLRVLWSYTTFVKVKTIMKYETANRTDIITHQVYLMENIIVKVMMMMMIEVYFQSPHNGLNRLQRLEPQGFA